uniref:Ig-like domain-containing protein n=1 Tax=Seriola dumerili TaxID=41447 RepID=A0A3B4V7K7_SERDU
MASLRLVFCLTFLFMGKMAALKFSSSVCQDSVFLSVKAGDNLTLCCFNEDDVSARLYWFKQTLGQKPRLISDFSVHDKNGIFYEEFKDNQRFTLDTKNGTNHLTISNLRTSDSATYYCTKGYSVTFTFLESIIVSVQGGSGLNIQASVHQSGSETIQPGGSVTLSCTVHTGTCDGEHSVYWFKDSEESHPGLIYTHGDRDDQCERKPETQTQTYIYNLPMQSLNLSHAGTYYCAVASCGHILFGDGTKLDFEGKKLIESFVSADKVDLMYFPHGAWVFTTVLSVFLAFSLCMMAKRNSCRSSESQPTFTAPSTANAEVSNSLNLYYAALSINLTNRSRRQRDQTWTECVYHSIKK